MGFQEQAIDPDGESAVLQTASGPDRSLLIVSRSIGLVSTR